MAVCVTGGTSGIGRAIAERLAVPNSDVFLNYHSDDSAASEAAAAIESLGATPHLVRADVGAPEGIRKLGEQIKDEVDRLDQLVHSAAKAVPGPLLDTDPSEIEQAVNVNGLSLVALVRELLPLLGDGSSVFYITSQGARTVIPGYGALGISKALGEHIVRHLATEIAGSGARVNAISPGPLNTAAFRTMFPDRWERLLDSAARHNPSGRGLELDDVSEAVAMLAKSEFRMVQGQNLTVDGGLSLFQ